MTLSAGFGSELKLSFSGSALIELNTTGVDKAPLNPADPAIKPGFKMVITAEVSFANFVSANGTVSVTYTNGTFELFFDVAVKLGPITVQASGFAGIYGGAQEANKGLVLRLNVSIDVELFDGIITVQAAGEFQLNTTVDRPRRGRCPDRGELAARQAQRQARAAEGDQPQRRVPAPGRRHGDGLQPDVAGRRLQHEHHARPW